MKKLLYILTFLYAGILAAQTDGITYQAVILDPNVQEIPGQDITGNVLSNAPVMLRFTISGQGSTLFQEQQQTQTDAFGMINVVIGEGSLTTGNAFNEILWDGTERNLMVEINLDGNYNTLSEQPLLFIPYAFHRDIIATGDIEIQGNSVFEGNVEVEGDTSLKNNLDVDGITTLNSALVVTNQSPVVLSGTLDVAQNAVFQNKANVDGELFVEGATILNNTLDVTGESVFESSFTVANQSPTSLSGSTTVEGITQLNDALNVAGEATLSSNLTVANESPTLLTGALDVNGVTTLNDQVIFIGSMEVNGPAQINGTLDVTDNASFEQIVTVGEELTIEGSLSVQENTIIDGVLTVRRDVVVERLLNVQGATTLDDSLTVTNGSPTVLSGTLEVSEGARLDANLSVDGITNLNNTLNVNNAAPTHLTGTLMVDGQATFNDEVTFESDIETTGLKVSGDAGVFGNHVALFENTSGDDSADGIAILIDNATLNSGNNFITFMGANDYVAGRVESFDLAAGESLGQLPNPDFDTIFGAFDFSSLIDFEIPELSFTPGSFPTLNPGSLPDLDIDFSLTDGLDWDFDDGSLPSLSGGSLPTASLDNPGSVDISFDNLINFDGLPDSGSAAADAFCEVIAFEQRVGLVGFYKASPWERALLALRVACTEFTRDQGVVYGSKGADYAEWLEKENPEDTFVFGEIVGVKGGKISKNTTDADHVMSISLNPIVLGNMPDQGRESDYEKVGFMGQVPALVAGKVAIGDFIVASGNNDGYGIAISPKNIELIDLKNIIGRAWSESEPRGLSMINVSVGLKTNEWITIFEKQQERIKKLETSLVKLETLESKIMALEARFQGSN